MNLYFFKIKNINTLNLICLLIYITKNCYQRLLQIIMVRKLTKRQEEKNKEITCFCNNSSIDTPN